MIADSDPQTQSGPVVGLIARCGTYRPPPDCLNRTTKLLIIKQACQRATCVCKEHSKSITSCFLHCLYTSN